MFDIAGYSSLEEFGAAVRSLAEQELEPIAAEFGERSEVCRPLLEKFGDLGFYRLLDQETGQGTWLEDHRWSAFVAVREALALVDSQLDEVFTIQNMGLFPLAFMGDAKQRERFLPDVTAGKRIAAFALSEPGAGSDVSSMTTTATRVTDGWSLTGDKTWISHAPDAEIYVIFARHAEDSGIKGYSAFVVEADSEGFARLPVLELMAPHAVGSLELRDVFVPEDKVLGEVGQGLRTALKTLNFFRPSVGGRAMGLARHALDVAVDWANERETFGSPLMGHQAVAFKLADMAIQIRAGRALVYEAALLADSADPNLGIASSTAKVFATEIAQKIIYDAQQICGARALVKGHPVEAIYRQARAMTIYEGTSEVQKLIASRHISRGNLANFWNF